MIELKDVSLFYGEHKALDEVSFSLCGGSFTTIVGHSGCGKSTLLMVLAGLLQTHSGSVMIEGKVVTGVSEKTTILLQDLGLFPWKTAIENIAFILRDRGASKIEALKQAMDALALVDMLEYKDRYIETLSGGQKQRVGFAKALALNPDVILFDEATAALDAFTSEQVQDMLKRVHKQSQATIVYVTHKVDEAVYLGESVLVMRDGRIAARIDNSIVDMEDMRDQDAFFELCKVVKGALK